MAAPARDYFPAVKFGSKWLPSDILGFGGVYGDDFYLVTAKDSTDVYYTWLTEHGISDGRIYSGIQAAHDAMTTAHNDVLYVMPGVHSESTVITLSKNKISLIGVGGPVSFNGSTGTNRIRVAATTMDSLFNVSGHYVSFYNLHTTSGAASTTVRGDIVLSGGAQNFYAQDCAFAGGGNSTQTASATSGIPITFDGDASYSGNYAKFVNCRIGSSSNAARATGAGAVRFDAAGSVQHTEFIQCVLAFRSETTDSAAPCLVHIAGDNAIDRYVWFKDCLFYNVWQQHVGKVDYVFHDESTSTQDILLQDCMMAGFDAWGNSPTTTTQIFTNKANAESDGGKAIAVDTTP